MYSARPPRLAPDRPWNLDLAFASVDDSLAWMRDNVDLMSAVASDAFLGGSAELGWLLLECGARAYFSVGDMLRFEQVLRDAVDLALAAGADAPAMVLTHILGVGYGNAGRVSEAQAAFERTIALADACGDEAYGLIDIGNLGQLHSLTGRLDKAVEASEHALALDTVDGLLFVHITLIEVERYRGDLDGAEARLRDTRQAAEGIDVASPDLAMIDLQEVAILLARGDQAGAVRRLPSIRARVGGMHASVDGCYAYILSALAECEAGDLDDAEKSVRTGLRIARECGSRLRETEALAALGEILLRQGRADDALAGLEQGLSRAQEAWLRYQECELSILAAEACLALDDTDRARALAASATEIAGSCGFRLLATRSAKVSATIG
jgi:tetratricopeptide (TPR) repeat protein